MSSRLSWMAVICCLLAISCGGKESASEKAADKEALGRALFFSDALSDPAGQACADCHSHSVGWTGPDSAINAAGAVMPGAVPTRSGNRKPPSSAYAGAAPVLGQCDTCDGAFEGGLFWNGRATGWTLGDPLAEQAMAPFLNPVEMNNEDAAALCRRVRDSEMAGLFYDVWGYLSLDCEGAPEVVLEQVAHAIAAFERSDEMNPFSSKFDYFWHNAVDLPTPVDQISMMNWTQFQGLGLTDPELMGLVVFNTKGKCSVCHPLTPGPEGTPPLFTDFRYHNLGIPKNPNNPFYGMPPEFNPDGVDWVDEGLGGFLAGIPEYAAFAAENRGKHRTPTLRNLEMRPDDTFVKAYGHNGFFKSVMAIVHFYNLRDALPLCGEGGTPGVDCWPPPEVGENIDTVNMGNLGLVPMEGMNLIAFLKTLTDGFEPPVP